MVDFRKIDAFFNGEKVFEEQGTQRLSRRAKLLRTAKLIMPSLAAVLIGLILIFPSLKKSSIVAGLDVTIPKKGELEKLHMEQTEFSITDKDNKVSTFTADQIDEIKPGSKVVKIFNPVGQIPAAENKLVNINADFGYYNQNVSVLKIEHNVKAVYDDGTTALTETATYDFKKSYGSGDKAVYAFGEWGKLWAEGFEFDQNQNLLVLTGKSKIINENRTLFADRTVKYFRNENRFEAEKNVKVLTAKETMYADLMKAYLVPGAQKMQIQKIDAFGNVKVIENNKTLTAEKMIAHFDSEQKDALKKIDAYGNVVVIENSNTIYADKMEAFFKPGAKDSLQKVESYGNVKIITADGTATGDYGVYLPEKGEMELHHNVTLIQDGNIIHGDKAVTNLKTSVSRMIADGKKGGRVSGVIKGSTVKNKK